LDVTRRKILQTPHSGYHWDGLASGFFEGWYFRLTLPEIRESFAFMYSIEDPSGASSHSGGAVQILGIDEQYLSCSFPNPHQFWATTDSLGLGHWGKTELAIRPQLLSSYCFTSSGHTTRSKLSVVLSDSPCLWLGTATAASASYRRLVILLPDL
jgi:tocopherol cyclase